MSAPGMQGLCCWHEVPCRAELCQATTLHPKNCTWHPSFWSSKSAPTVLQLLPMPCTPPSAPQTCTPNPAPCTPCLAPHTLHPRTASCTSYCAPQSLHPLSCSCFPCLCTPHSAPQSLPLCTPDLHSPAFSTHCAHHTAPCSPKPAHSTLHPVPQTLQPVPHLPSHMHFLPSCTCSPCAPQTLNPQTEKTPCACWKPPELHPLPVPHTAGPGRAPRLGLRLGHCHLPSGVSQSAQCTVSTGALSLPGGLCQCPQVLVCFVGYGVSLGGAPGPMAHQQQVVPCCDEVRIPRFPANMFSGVLPCARTSWLRFPAAHSRPGSSEIPAGSAHPLCRFFWLTLSCFPSVLEPECLSQGTGGSCQVPVPVV